MYDKSKLILGILLVLMLTSNSTSADLISDKTGAEITPIPVVADATEAAPDSPLKITALFLTSVPLEMTSETLTATL